MKKIAIITILAIAILMFVKAPFAQAAEINPTPGTFSYGSTSEFSPYSTLSQGSNPTPGGGGLAPTGQNAWLLYAIAILTITAPLAYFGIKKLKK